MRRSGNGGLGVVEGPAGSGKSALLGAAKERANAAGMRVLDARGSELEVGLAFGAIRQLFEKVITDAPPAEQEALLAGAAAPAAWVITPRSASSGPAEAAADARFAAMHGIYWLATNLSVAAPLFLAVDDLYWVDGSSVHALTYLARRIADLSIVLVVAVRPDEPGSPVELIDQLRAEPEAVRVTLRPLGRESVAAIVRAFIPDADDALSNACHTATAGNPFYLLELLPLLRAVAEAATGDEQIRHDYETMRRRFDEFAEQSLRGVADLGRTPPADLSETARALNLMGVSYLLDALGREPRVPPQTAVQTLTEIWEAVIRR